MRHNDPDMQNEVGKDETRAVMSTISPTLMVINQAYGDDAAVVWLSKQLTVFNEYVGKREKMDGWQITNLAQSIVTNCSQLKASEVMLFLYQYRTGKWGPLYGAVGPQEFMVVLRDRFMPWRSAIVAEAQNAAARAERESYYNRPEALKPDEVRALRKRLERQWREEEQKKERQ